MKTVIDTTFEALTLKFETTEEVQELQAILFHVKTNNANILKIYNTCKSITKVPMSGLYHGNITRNHP